MFVIYGRDNCAACRASKLVLEELGYAYEYVGIDDGEDEYARFREVYPYTNVIPQITYNETVQIHGYQELLHFINNGLSLSSTVE